MQRTDNASPPPGFAPYRTTPIFNAATIPAGLCGDHATKPGVWAVIQVLEGVLTFAAVDPTEATEIHAGERLACAPERRHRVTPSEDVRFRIEFWRQEASTGGAPDGRT